jgi:hypothetical protein
MCPFCGAELPPLPVLQAGEASPTGRLLTGRAWLDTTLGIVAAMGSVFLFCIGVAAPVVLYFVLRQSYPALARGLGYGLMTLGAIVLGLLAICVVSLTQGRW